MIVPTTTTDIATSPPATIFGVTLIGFGSTKNMMKMDRRSKTTDFPSFGIETGSGGTTKTELRSAGTSGEHVTITYHHEGVVKIHMEWRTPAKPSGIR